MWPLDVSRYLCLTVLLILIWSISGNSVIGGETAPEAVYDSITVDCRVKGHRIVVEKSVRLTINNAHGDKHNGLVVYESRYSRVKSVSARVLNAQGEEIYRRKKKDLRKTCGFGRMQLYQDVCYYTCELGAPKYPYIIEYDCKTEVKSLFGWPGLTMQYEIPVDYASYTLTISNQDRFRYRVYGLSISPTVEQTSDGTIYRWEAHDIPALDDAGFLPPDLESPARIVFVPEQFELDGYEFQGTDWTAVGSWYHKLARGRYLQEEHLMNREPEVDNMTVAREIYDDVIRTTRYVAVTIGIGGWQPIAAEETEKTGYGDCKALTTLLISRLRNSGLEAYPCLLSTKSSGPIDTAFPALQFNHVITMAFVNGDTLWMDPTCQNCPMNDIPMSDENSAVLIVDSGGGYLGHTPASTAEENMVIQTTDLHLNRDLTLAFDTEMKITGNDAIYMRGRIPSLSSEEVISYIHQRFPGADQKFKIESYEIVNLDDLYQPLIIKFHAQCHKKVDKLRGNIYVSPFMLCGLRGFEKEELDDRTAPLDFYYPETMIDRYSLRWDSSLGINEVIPPAADSLTASFGDISLQIEISNSCITLELTKRYFNYRLDPESFDEFELFRDRMKEINGRYVKLSAGG